MYFLNYHRLFSTHISVCKKGYYGKNCSLVCSPNCKTCRHTDGLCTCKAGWMGPNCTIGNQNYSVMDHNVCVYMSLCVCSRTCDFILFEYYLPLKCLQHVFGHLERIVSIHVVDTVSTRNVTDSMEPVCMEIVH